MTHVPAPLPLRPRRRRRHRTARARGRSPPGRARPRRHGPRRGLHHRGRAGLRGDLPSLGARPEPTQPPPRARPVQGLGVQEPVRAVHPAARHPVRRPGARLRRRRHRGDRRAPSGSRGVLVLRLRGDGRRRGCGHPLRRPDAERVPAAGPGHAAPRARGEAGCRPARSGAGSPRDRAGHPPVEQGTAPRQRPARLPRPRSARLVLRAGPPGPPAAGADVARLRLPGRAARHGALRRRRARRPGLGRRDLVDATCG